MYQTKINQFCANNDIDAVIEHLAITAIANREKRAQALIKLATPNNVLDNISSGLTNHIATPIANGLGMSRAAAQLGKHLGWGLGGAALGSAIGAGTQIFAPEKKRRYLSGAITGGLLGGSAGVGGSLLHSNIESLRELVGSTSSESGAARKEFLRKQQEAREAAGTTNPELESAGSNWKTDPGLLNELARRRAHYGEEAAFNDWITESKASNRMFSLPPNTTTTLKSDPKNPNLFSYDQKDKAELFKILRQMSNSADNAGLTGPIDRRLNDLATIPDRVGKGHIGALDPGFGGVLGTTKSRGIGPDLASAISGPSFLSGNRLNPEKYRAAAAQLKDLGFTPTEILETYKQGQPAMDELIKLVTAQKRQYLQNGQKVTWDEDTLRQRLPEIISQTRSTVGDTGLASSVLNKLPTTGNTYLDALVAPAALDVGGTAYNWVQNLKGANPKNILWAINNGKLPASIAANPRAVETLTWLASKGEGEIASFIKDPHSYMADVPQQVQTLEKRIADLKLGPPPAGPASGNKVIEYLRTKLIDPLSKKILPDTRAKEIYESERRLAELKGSPFVANVHGGQLAAQVSGIKDELAKVRTEARPQYSLSALQESVNRLSPDKSGLTSEQLGLLKSEIGRIGAITDTAEQAKQLEALTARGIPGIQGPKASLSVLQNVINNAKGTGQPIEQALGLTTEQVTALEERLAGIAKANDPNVFNSFLSEGLKKPAVPGVVDTAAAIPKFKAFTSLSEINRLRDSLGRVSPQLTTHLDELARLAENGTSAPLEDFLNQLRRGLESGTKGKGGGRGLPITLPAWNTGVQPLHVTIPREIAQDLLGTLKGGSPAVEIAKEQLQQLAATPGSPPTIPGKDIAALAKSTEPPILPSSIPSADAAAALSEKLRAGAVKLPNSSATAALAELAPKELATLIATAANNPEGTFTIPGSKVTINGSTLAELTELGKARSGTGWSSFVNPIGAGRIPLLKKIPRFGAYMGPMIAAELLAGRGAPTLKSDLAIEMQKRLKEE